MGTKKAPSITDIIKGMDTDEIGTLFNSIESMLGNDKDSEVAKAWNDSKEAAYKNSRHGYEGWDGKDGTYKQMYGKEKSNPEMSFFINKMLMPGLGAAAKVAGTGLGATHSILGQALMSMGPNLYKTNDPFDHSDYANAAGLGASIAGAKEMGKGALFAAGGNALGDYLTGIGDALEARDEKARVAQYQMNESPTGKYWDQMGRLGRAMSNAE